MALEAWPPVPSPAHVFEIWKLWRLMHHSRYIRWLRDDERPRRNFPDSGADADRSVDRYPSDGRVSDPVFNPRRQRDVAAWRLFARWTSACRWLILDAVRPQ